MAAAVAAAAPASAVTLKRGRNLTIASGLTLLVMAVVALGTYMHMTHQDAHSLFQGHRTPGAINTEVGIRLRRHLAWGGGEDAAEEVLNGGGDDEENQENGGDMEGPGVPEDGTTTKKKKKKFSFDNELNGDEEPAADEEVVDGGEDGEEVAPKKKKKEASTKKKKAPAKKKPKGMPKATDDGDEAAAGDEEADPDAPVAEDGEEDAAAADDEVEDGPRISTTKKPKKSKRPVSDQDEEDANADAGGDEGEDGTVVIKARPGGSTSRVSKGGGKKNPEDGKKDPLAPTLDTRDSRRFADEVVLPNGHTVSIDVPSP